MGRPVRSSGGRRGAALVPQAVFGDELRMRATFTALELEFLILSLLKDEEFAHR